MEDSSPWDTVGGFARLWGGLGRASRRQRQTASSLAWVEQGGGCAVAETAVPRNRNKDTGNGLPTLNSQSEPFHFLGWVEQATILGLVLAISIMAWASTHDGAHVGAAAQRSCGSYKQEC
ncbi:hypothetical protein TIFTF001_017299 [Ficus carica]|uniref:Uncharacterized protein n=1 Tax=Ficus carica TaxID=3494 RepID=A0AA88ABX8_FICCA|nr:hypothetical protein TIFTF001_017299 [Ficus carica]